MGDRSDAAFRDYVTKGRRYYGIIEEFKAFGEDYHEKKLEEAYIFPAVKKAGGEAAGYADVLVVQHNRGREITDYIISVTQGAKLGASTSVILIRLVVGGVFLSEGIQKFLFPNELGVGRFIKIGIPAPQVMGPFVGIVEIICGSLIILGLLTRYERVNLWASIRETSRKRH